MKRKTKGEKREEKKRRKTKMKVSGKSVFQIKVLKNRLKSP